MDGFDLAPVPLFRTSLDGTITHANVAASEATGVEQRLLPGTPLAAHAADGRALRLLVVRANALAPGETLDGEATFEGPFGPRAVALSVRRSVTSLDWALTDARRQSPLERELGTLAAELEARVDERTAVQLETEQAWLAAILDELPAGVIVASASSGRIVLANAQAEQIGFDGQGSDVQDSELRGFDAQGRRLEPQDWPLARALGGGEPVRDERIRIERTDGSWLTIEASASPIRDRTGRIAAAVAVFWDVSERERRERAEREFITNAAHELQTPLAAIVSSVEVLTGGAKEVPEDRDRFLGHVERESARLVRIVRSLLLLARTQLAHESVVLAPLRLRPLLDEIALGLRPRRGIEVVVRCPARLTLPSNAELLEQAVGNLAANSARHTLSGRITLSASRRADGIHVEVADTGPGIDAADAERLFERFTRGDRRGPEGFGLGLAIVRETVAALGGTVSLAPRRGGGTVARIVFPETGTDVS